MAASTNPGFRAKRDHTQAVASGSEGGEGGGRGAHMTPTARDPPGSPGIPLPPSPARPGGGNFLKLKLLNKSTPCETLSRRTHSPSHRPLPPPPTPRLLTPPEGPAVADLLAGALPLDGADGTAQAPRRGPPEGGGAGPGSGKNTVGVTGRVRRLDGDPRSSDVF